MKYFLSVFALVLCLCVSCNSDSEQGKLSTELVNNPKSATESSNRMPAIEFEKTEHDFGKVLQGEVVTYSFHFTNTGNAPLLISNVSTSCGCTVGDYPHTPIAPGEGGVIKATYNSKGHHGMQNRSLTVVANTMPNRTMLHLKAMVNTPDQY